MSSYVSSSIPDAPITSDDDAPVTSDEPDQEQVRGPSRPARIQLACFRPRLGQLACTCECSIAIVYLNI